MKNNMKTIEVRIPDSVDSDFAKEECEAIYWETLEASKEKE